MPTFLNTSGPVGEEDVGEFERRHGVRLPPSYRSFLLETNGGAPKPNAVADRHVEYLYSLNGSRDSVDLEFAQGSFVDLPPSHIAIGIDAFGNPFVLDCAAGAVCLLDHKRGEGEHEVRPLAESFEAFLALLHAPAR